jgi:tRNA (guanine-N(7)-)-methyltransferase
MSKNENRSPSTSRPPLDPSPNHPGWDYSRPDFDYAVMRPFRFDGQDLNVARLRKSRKFIGETGRNAGLTGPSIPAGSYFCLQPEQLFSHPAPLEVELGSGKGDFILERSAQFPQRNFLAVELAGSVFQWLSVRIERSRLPNVRALRADARPLVSLFLPDGSVREFHIYFPDPWPKSRHSKHRLFSPALVGGLMRCLEPGGAIHVATDVDWYFEYIAGLFAEHGFKLTVNGAPGAANTGFGRRFVNAGKAIHAGCFEPAGALELQGNTGGMMAQMPAGSLR